MFCAALRTLRTSPLNVLPGKASTVNVTRLARADAPDVGLVDRGLDLHVAQVLGDDEEFGSLQRRSDGLADIDGALDDDAIDRRAYLRASRDQPERSAAAPCVAALRPALYGPPRRPGRTSTAPGRVPPATRNCAPPAPWCAPDRAACSPATPAPGSVRTAGFEIRLGLPHAVGEGFGIDASDQLALLDLPS